MGGARPFFTREKYVFLVGFSLTIPRFPQIQKLTKYESRRDKKRGGIIFAPPLHGDFFGMDGITKTMG